MKVLVIGGTRFIGPAIVRRLLTRGHDVAVLHRGETPGTLGEDVEHIQGDRDRLADSRGALHRFGPDVVIHNVVNNRHNVETALDAFRGMAQRLVLVSSMDVYRAYGRLGGTEPGALESMPQDETAPLREHLYPYRKHAEDSSDPRWTYDKIPAEKAVLGDEDLPGTVLRLPMVLGPGDYQHRLFGLVRPMVDGRHGIVLQEGYAHWQSTYAHVENVGEAIVLAATHEAAAGRVYNVADGALSTLELGALAARTLGWDGEFVLLPRDELPDELVMPWRVEQSLVAQAERIRAELGYEALVELEDGVRETVRWERDNPPDPIPEDRLNYAAQDQVLGRL
jgi:nucleoside-diphosphate-sugar epimerase